jgi:hypothetical protein
MSLYKDLNHYLQGNAVFASPSLPLWDSGPFRFHYGGQKYLMEIYVVFLLLLRNNGTIVRATSVKHHTKASNKHILSMFFIQR